MYCVYSTGYGFKVPVMYTFNPLSTIPKKSWNNV